MQKQRGLSEPVSARELLEDTYCLLKNKLGGREVEISAITEIARDVDGRTGSNIYEKAMFLKVSDKKWAVSFGTKGGGYLSDPYNCDIAAVPVFKKTKSKTETNKEIEKEIERGGYFRNSLIFAKENGRLSVNKDSRFDKKVSDLLMPKAREFIARDLETDPKLFTLDLRPVLKSGVQYKLEFANFLFDVFCKVLAS